MKERDAPSHLRCRATVVDPWFAGRAVASISGRQRRASASPGLTIFLRSLVQSGTASNGSVADVPCMPALMRSHLSSASPRRAHSPKTWTVVLNKSLNSSFKWEANDTRATFGSDADRKDEHSISIRAQFPF